MKGGVESLNGEASRRHPLVERFLSRALCEGGGGGGGMTRRQRKRKQQLIWPL